MRNLWKFVGCVAFGMLLLASISGARAAGFTVLTKYPLPDTEVKCVLVDEAHGVVYIGGVFTSVSGEPRNHLAAINASTGALLPWNPGANDIVFSLLLRDGILYVGGSFTTLNGTARSRIGALAAITELSSSTAILTSFNPSASDSVIALAADGTNIYAGGFFNAIGGQNYAGLAKLDPGTDNAVAGWNPNPSVVFSLAVSGSSLYVGGSFATIGGQNRANLASLDTATGNASSWNPNPNNTVGYVGVFDNRVYVGGVFDNITGQNRGHFVAFKTADNSLDADFDPQANNPVASMAIDGGIAYVGGGFTSIGGEPRSRIAALDLSTGFATGWNPGVSNDVNAVDVFSGVVFIGAYNTTQIGGVTITPSFDFAGVTENAVVEPAAPLVKISGKAKVTTTKSKITIKGSSSVADGSVSDVKVKVGSAGYKSAKGTGSWSFVAKLKPGKNKITAIATGTNGLSSAPVKVTVTRK